MCIRDSCTAVAVIIPIFSLSALNYIKRARIFFRSVTVDTIFNCGCNGWESIIYYFIRYVSSLKCFEKSESRSEFEKLILHIFKLI